MFSKSLFHTVSAAAVALTLALPGAAAGAALDDLELSMRLYRAGVAAADPVLVLSAAKLRKAQAPNFERIEVAVHKDRSQDPQGGKGAASGQTAPVGWEEMLDTARDLADGDAALLAMIDDVAAESAKGVATGQVYSISEIGDGGTDTYSDLPFSGGEYAEVYVESADGSDLNLYVYDSAGRLVCSDTDPSAISYCGWRPAETGAFTIEVKNQGGGTAGYSLMTN